MIFGIEFYEVLLFLRQGGLATAGAASFWGLALLLSKNLNTNYRETTLVASRRLLYVFFPATFLYIMSWTILGAIFCVFCADAHEGITRINLLSELIIAIEKQYEMFVILSIVSTLGLLFFTFKRKIFLSNLKWFYGVAFLTISFLMLYPWQIFEPLKITLASSLHTWHSILTVGSVIVVDFLYITMRKSSVSFLVRLFSLITKGIWIGLGLDFISSGLVFDIGYLLSEKFLFNQMVIGVIIINGAILAGPIFRKIASLNIPKPKKFGLNTYTITGVSGSISIASWLTITAIDGFKTLSLSYLALTFFYIVFIAVIFIGHILFDKFIVPKLS